MADISQLNNPSAPWNLTFMSAANNPTKEDTNSPAYVSEASQRMIHRSQLSRDLAEGLNAVMLRVVEYLPRHENEQDDDYNLRKKFSSLRNFYAQATKSILGKVFAQPPRLNPDTPEVIRIDLENADMNGSHWSVVSKRLMEAALHMGISWLYVDFPPVEIAEIGSLTLEEERIRGLRPYWAVVPQTNVLGVRYSKRGSIFTITQFRYMEWTMESLGAFGEQMICTIKVVEPEFVTLYRRGTDGVWVVHDVRVNTLGKVPVVPLNLSPEDGAFEASPPLENLAFMNLEHFQIRSDQRRALAAASFPILVTKGVEASPGTQTRIGPFTSIMLEDSSADVKWVESTGNHLRAGADELARLESDMRTFGLSFENPQMYATATGRNIDASDAVAPIQFWALQLKDVVELALAYHAEWRKLPYGGSIDINTAFLKNMITVEGLKLLVEALKEGAMSKEAFLERMKDYGLLGDDFDVNAEIKRLTQEAKEAAALLPKPAPGLPTPI